MQLVKSSEERRHEYMVMMIHDMEMKEEGRVEGIDQTRVESIKNIMNGLKYTAQQAMDLLKIPAANQAKYLGKL